MRMQERRTAYTKPGIKQELCVGLGWDTQPFHKHLHVNAASPNVSSEMDTACLIPNCARASVATGMWRGLQWLLLGH